MKAVVFTLGCKVNEVESAQLCAALEGRGFEVSEELSPADIYVLNTCAVTKEAERKSRQLIARAAKFNKDAAIYICGCASQKDKAQFQKQNVRYICGATDKREIINAIVKDFGGAPCASLPYPKQLKTRAFIKIEDGCNNFCSYCVIPHLRGRVTCREVEDIVNEVKACTAPEIVLTGINVSAYNNLPALIKELRFTNKRIRFGSLECNVITEEFLSSLKDLQDFAPHFHLSLQSGSNAVLRAMNRHYTREEYLKKCALIYSHFPTAAITTDIIAGFCGETEKDFKESLKIIEEAGFSRIHAFAFSPREGTAAFGRDDIPPQVKAERVRALIERGRLAEEKFLQRFIGATAQVIFEEFNGEYTSGYTANYIKVFVKGNHHGRANVMLTKPFVGGALAEVISEKQ